MRVGRRFYLANIFVVPCKRTQHCCASFAGHRTIEMLGLVAPKFHRFQTVRNKCQQVPTLLWFQHTHPFLLSSLLALLLVLRCHIWGGNRRRTFCYVIGLKKIRIRLSTRIRILRVLKRFHTGEWIQKVADSYDGGYVWTPNGRRIRKENVADSKISGYVSTEPQTPSARLRFGFENATFFSFLNKNIACTRIVFESFLPVHTNTLYRYENVRKPFLAVHERFNSYDLERGSASCLIMSPHLLR